MWHLAGRPLRDLDQLPQDGVVGALQRLHGDLLRHGAQLDARLQQPVAVAEQIPARQVVSAAGKAEDHLSVALTKRAKGPSDWK